MFSSTDKAIWMARNPLQHDKQKCLDAKKSMRGTYRMRKKPQCFSACALFYTSNINKMRVGLEIILCRKMQKCCVDHLLNFFGLEQ